MAEQAKKKPTTTKSDTTKKATTKSAPKSEAPKKEGGISDLIDIRIFAVPERKEWAERNQKLLKIPDDHMIWDKEHIGVIPTAKKAWLIETKKPFVMVMNDDAEICKDFIKYCEKIITLHPDHIISLFPFQFRTRRQVRNKARRSPYIATTEVMGLGVIMKKEYIKTCLDSWDEKFGDYVNITRWAIANEIPILTTLPSIIQHIGDDSIQDPLRTIGRTDFFDPDPVNENWDDGFVTAWSNVVLD